LEEVRAERVSALELLAGFRGGVDRRTYALVGFGLMLLKYAVDAALVYGLYGAFWTPLDYLNPVLMLRQERLGPGSTHLFQLGMAVWTLPFLWIGVSMTMRRAYDAGLSAWLGLLFFVPILNYVLMLSLCRLPSRPRAQDFELLARAPPGGPRVDAQLSSALTAVLLTALLASGFVLLLVSGFKAYGTALFAGSPFLLGVLAAFIFNRRELRSFPATLGVVALSVLMSGGLILLFALDGAICIAMALPLALSVALLGGVVGRGLAGLARQAVAPSALSLCALPLVALIEARWSAPAAFRVDSAIEVDAPPEVVWEHVVAFSELPPPHWILFRLGVAYPLRARIAGEGVGAIRRCEFSTGAFIEPITVWDAPARLAFDVASQPPPMHEWSPYAGLEPRHLDGYLKSTRGEFRLVALDGGRRTRLEGTTWYELDVHPTGYWRLWSDLLIHRIHLRVLEHVAALSEGRA
jgi:uncharacterized membrane protein YhaH (DUF805 family)